MITLTPNQLHLARHALGLEYGQKRSYRNRFFAANITSDGIYADWRAMVNAGAALRVPWGWSGGDLFFMTRAGAEAVLRPGETLDPEDF